MNGKTYDAEGWQPKKKLRINSVSKKRDSVAISRMCENCDRHDSKENVYHRVNPNWLYRLQEIVNARLASGDMYIVYVRDGGWFADSGTG